MRPVPPRSLVAAAAFLLMGSLPIQAAGNPVPAAKEPGDLWEVSSQMSMDGMPMEMPAQTQRVCTAKEWKEPPGAMDEEQKCETFDFKSTPAKTTWKTRCAGPPEMTGEGEITRSAPDAYTGLIKMTSSEGNMTLKLKGRRVGDCDAAASRKQAEKNLAQAEKMQKDMAVAQADLCKQLAEAMELRMMTMQGSNCNDAATHGAFCQRFQTVEGLKILASHGNAGGNSLKDALAYCDDAASREAYCRNLQTLAGFQALASLPTGLSDAAATCGKDLAQVQAALCVEALKSEDLDYLGENCPAQTQELAKRECAGRKYTSLQASKYQSFCVRYAREELAGAPPAQEAEETKSKKDKTKKFFKSIIPH